MMKYLLAVAGIITAGIICTSCNSSNTNTGQNPVYVNQFEKLTDDVIAAGTTPGLIVGVWAPGEDVAWVTAKGKANTTTGDLMKTTYRFRMGSITKSFTYTVLLQLVDEKQLSLDDKLSKYFPGFPDADKVTVRMICNHTSGIFNYSSTSTFGDGINANPARVWTDQELIDLASREAYYYSPGNGYRYSNTNTIMAGMIVEQITKNTIDTEINDRLLIPLGLKNTYYPKDCLISGQHASGYQGTVDVTEMFHPSNAGSSGALITDIQDLKTWVEAAVKGTFLSADLQKQRLTVISPADMYGLGLKAIDRGGSGLIWGHSGSIFGYQTMAYHWPAKNVTVAICYNNTMAVPDTLFNSIIDTFK